MAGTWMRDDRYSIAIFRCAYTCVVRIDRRYREMREQNQPPRHQLLLRSLRVRDNSLGLA